MTLIERYLTNNDCYKANVAKADSRYVVFQERGPQGLMLHSVGCAQPSAEVLINRWNAPSIDKCVHGFVDANTGAVYQTLPWNYRGWHGGGSCNNTHLGVEMCESSYIKYTSGATFEILDLAKAQADCKRTYDSAVQLFAMLCAKYGLDPLTQIISHKEGGKIGIASGHVDPEHYWNGLSMPYTMDTFRADVANAMAEPDMPFTDVKETSYAYQAILRCYQRGLMVGTSPTTFSPKKAVTREQLAVVIDRAISYLGGG